MVVKKGESGHTGGGAAESPPGCTPESGTARFCRVFQGFGPPGDLRGPFLQSVSRIWASRRSPRPVLAKCLKDLGLPEISAARI